jgi:hypothetical protein
MSDEIVQPKPVVSDSPKTEEPTKPEIEDIPEEPAIDPDPDAYRTSPLFYEVANYFGVEDREYGVAKDKLSIIVDWAEEQSGSKKMEDVLYEIRKAENKIQKPQWGEKRYTNLYRYIRLASQKNSVEKAMSAYEKWGGYKRV